MDKESKITETINFDSREKAGYIAGKDEANLALLSKEYKVEIINRDRVLKVSGNPLRVAGTI